MRQRFSARELWLFLSFLLIGVAALLYWRWEQMPPPGKRGFYASKVEVVPITTGMENPNISHYVRVTLSHSQPRPSWWGKKKLSEFTLDPLAPQKPPTLWKGSSGTDMIAAGGVLGVEYAGEIMGVKVPFSKSPGAISFDGENYVVEHTIGLDGLPQQMGEVTFNGIYQMTDTPKRVVTRVLRVAGAIPEPMFSEQSFRLEKAEVFIVSAKALKWKKERQVGKNGALETMDTIGMEVIVERTKPLAPGAEKHKLSASVNFAQDEKRSKVGRVTAPVPIKDRPNLALKPNQSGEVFTLMLNEKEKTQGSIVAKGEVWVFANVSQVFEIRLPPRLTVTPPVK